MEWRVLEEHFRTAARQKPAPFGDDAIEWDYSRYARALGLTGLPGLHDLPHEGVAILDAPPGRWDGAKAKYDAWAQRAGWTCVRLSARPTVAVPDPVVHALGEAIAGRDGLMFARSGGSGAPALGVRPRSDGCSLPLTTGERWLIATDRVRRRARAEIARRGLILFVEDAHRLTGAAAGLLVHLLDAHRAWRDRMIARDAKAYVVLAAPPGRNTGLLAQLRRFGIKGHVPVARDRAPARIPDLSLEEEQLLAALAAAPLALTERDVASVFGASARYLGRALAERGHVRIRLEEGKRCFVPHPACGEDSELPRPPGRVLEAFVDVYRARLRRRARHGHVRYALAALEARLGNRGRALAHLSRCAYANAVTVPHDQYVELERLLTEGPEPSNRNGSPTAGMRAIHRAIQAALHAHQRNYEAARTAAEELTKQPIRNETEFYRVIVQILCTGRTHMDAYVPEGFWATLQVQDTDPSLADAACILADLFARQRLMKPEEISTVFLFAEECLRNSEGRGASRLRLLVQALRLRVLVHVRALFKSTSTGSGATFASYRSILLGGQTPAYVLATLAYGAIVVPSGGIAIDLDETDRQSALELVRATGNPCDSRIQLGGRLQALVARRLQLLARELADELVLLLYPSSPCTLRRRLGLVLQCMAGPRTWRLSAAKLIPGHTSHEPVGDLMFECSSIARALMYTGDFAGARDSLRCALDGGDSIPHSVAHVVQTEALLARKSLMWSDLDRARSLLQRHCSSLPTHLYGHIRYFVEGSAQLCSREFAAAEESFRESRRLGGTLGIGLATLHHTATASEECSRRLRHFEQGRKNGARALRTLIGGMVECVMMRFSYGAGASCRVVSALDYIALALETWAQRAAESTEQRAIGIALLFARSTDAALRPIGQDLIDGLARTAPTFFACLQRALQDQVGYVTYAGPPTRAVMTALGLVRNVWVDTDFDLAVHAAGIVRLSKHGVSARQARLHKRQWEEDGSTYNALIARAYSRSEPVCRVDGYGYLGTDGHSHHRLTLAWTKLRSPAGVVLTQTELDTKPASHVATRKRDEQAQQDVVQFLGDSEAAHEVRRMIGRAADCDYPVLVTGETGVGKEVVARSIHASSARASRELIVADCAALVDSIVESELFGHARGAFTGAVSDHVGYVERANGSTLLLDELDSMSRRMQAVLLRVLETGEYRPVGGQANRLSDLRLVAAASPRLYDRMDDGGFRHDLYYRLSAFRIQIPPLRERQEDTAVLASAFADRLGIRLSAAALTEIRTYLWPGNARQLWHCIQVAALHEPGRQVSGEAMRAAIMSSDRTGKRPPVHDDSSSGWARTLQVLKSGSFSALDYAAHAGLSRRSAQRHLARLLRRGQITRVGAGRSTQYRVSESGHL